MTSHGSCETIVGVVELEAVAGRDEDGLGRKRRHEVRELSKPRRVGQCSVQKGQSD